MKKENKGNIKFFKQGKAIKDFFNIPNKQPRETKHFNIPTEFDKINNISITPIELFPEWESDEAAKVKLNNEEFLIPI